MLFALTSCNSNNGDENATVGDEKEYIEKKLYRTVFEDKDELKNYINVYVDYEIINKFYYYTVETLSLNDNYQFIDCKVDLGVGSAIGKKNFSLPKSGNGKFNIGGPALGPDSRGTIRVSEYPGVCIVRIYNS